ncbi:MAG: TrkH family potassium uptake protein [Marinicaulis sp.]|nr:hypothetical protein [Marinicaulis sp.]NNE42217.1 TrkH family potassium uptake protein [Marinicaulis sp.]NNL89113.1 TrkH family potassium uptake protein [Marinicaulis sp.]
MGLTSIFRAFGASLLIVAVAMIAPYFVALASGDETSGGFLFAILVTTVTGAGAFAASTGRSQPADMRGALIVILLWWCIVPIFAALPIAINGLTFADAYFEAVSAMTTTGAWLSGAAAIEGAAGALWRAQLQWLGGLASLSIAAAIFIRPAFIGIDTLLPPFSRGEKDSYLRSIRNAVSAFVVVYAIITCFAFIVLSIMTDTVLDAAIIALSTVASGGFIPREGGIAAYSSDMARVLFPIIVLSGANFVLVARLMRGSRERVRDMESRAYFLMIIIVAMLFWILLGAGDLALIFPQIFNAASLLSTNGFVIGEAPPLAVAMVTAIIGGAAVSTAGGFKILRWLVIMRRAREEIRRLIIPNAIFGRRRVSNELGVWTHFLVFTMTLGILVIALSMGGYSFDIVAATATAALSNTGPLIYVADSGIEGYAFFSEPIRWLLLAAMIIGRLEAAVALALFNIAFWRT